MTSVREKALIHAQTWLGTPYRHQTSVRGEGADCLGLVRGVWRELYGSEPDRLPPYSPHWAERGSEDMLLQASRRWLTESDPKDAMPGDIILFRFSPETLVKHCAILSGPDRMIHAWQGQAVCETTLGPWWRRRLCAVFSFPEIA